jgi:GNAT superfamily N-acetyltransferase
LCRTYLSPVHQTLPCRNQHQRQHRRFTHAQGRGFLRQQARINYRIFRQRALCAANPGCQRIHIIANLPPTRARADGFNGARQVHPEYRRQRLARMSSLACANFAVQWVKATGANPNQHLASAGHWLGHCRQPKRRIHGVHNQSVHISHVGDLVS